MHCILNLNLYISTNQHRSCIMSENSKVRACFRHIHACKPIHKHRAYELNEKVHCFKREACLWTLLCENESFRKLTVCHNFCQNWQEEFNVSAISFQIMLFLKDFRQLLVMYDSAKTARSIFDEMFAENAQFWSALHAFVVDEHLTGRFNSEFHLTDFIDRKDSYLSRKECK